MTKKFHYFNLSGLGESIRYMLHYGGHKFEDIRYESKEWPIQSVKDNLPYGQLPLYEEGARKLNQSVAIARYIANQCHLLPSDPWEQAVLDAVVLSIYDFIHKVGAYVKEKDPAKKEEIKKEILSETVDFFLSRFEEELKSNNGHFGGKLTWADFILVGIIEAADLILGVEIEKQYRNIVKLTNKIRSLPGVKEYVASRKPYSM